MLLTLENRRRLAVAIGFGTFILASLVVASIFGLVPSPWQACQQKCTALYKTPTLVYSGPVASKRGVVSDVLFSSCECR